MSISAKQGKYMMQCWSSQKGYRPMEVEKTRGCWIYPKNGKRIFDLRSAHECANLGFNHPEILRAMEDQMKKVAYVTDDFATKPTAELSEKLAKLTPGSPNKKVWFGQSGASSIEAAIKAARMFKYNELIERGPSFYDASNQYPYPYKIITRYRSWHGATMGALSAGTDPRKWFAEPLTAPGFIAAPESYPYRSPFGDDPDGKKSLRYLKHIIEMEGGSGSIAAFLIEPVVGSNGIIPTPVYYMKKVRELCDEFGILLIVDETMTGMGRTGKLLAIEHYDIVPDIIVMGKALGMYSPLSATIFSEKVARGFDQNIFGHGQSYSGHSLGCAAALASLNILEEKHFMANVQEKGDYLQKKLMKLQDKYSFIGDVRGLGLMWTLELVNESKNRSAYRNFMQKYERTPVQLLAEHLLEQNRVYVPGDKFGVWIVPPLVVTLEEIDWLVEQLDDSLRYFKQLIENE
ncbi:MAG: aminotransferase class III-fold pyridoxal phosphate-dependent enzyme [Bacteroidetes bacterium]|nr:aminotransferase class III-fold pyridoxal phosphate-dependent enzyme [Bacteroidota bacterium]